MRGCVISCSLSTRSFVRERSFAVFGLDVRRGFAKWSRTAKREQRLRRASYEKNMRNDLEEKFRNELGYVPTEEHGMGSLPFWERKRLVRERELSKRGSARIRGPGTIPLGRKDVELGLEDLDQIDIDDLSEEVPGRKLHHRQLLRRGLPRPNEEKPNKRRREIRQMRAEERLRATVQEAFQDGTFPIIQELVGAVSEPTWLASPICTRVECSLDLSMVKVFWQPPLQPSGNAYPPEIVELFESALGRSRNHLRSVIARRMQHRRAAQVALEHEKDETDWDRMAAEVLAEIEREETFRL